MPEQGTAIFNRVVKVGLAEKMISEQRPGGVKERASWQSGVPGGRSSEWEGPQRGPGVVKEEQGGHCGWNGVSRLGE